MLARVGTALLLACGCLRALAMRDKMTFEAEVKALNAANLTRGSMVLGHYRILRRLGVWPPEGYELDREIGRGMFGIAYLATNTQTSEQVVLKVFTDMTGKLIKGKGAGRDQTKRIKAAKGECAASGLLIGATAGDEVGEGRFVKCLGTNIGADGAPVSDEAYVEMEYFEGQTVAAWAASFEEMEYPDAATLTNMLKMMLQGLAHIEGHYVHCDIKEDNVMVSNDLSDLKFIDFGFVTQAGVDSGDIAGSMQYKPPESLRDVLAYVPQSSWDVWSVGIVIFQILCDNSWFNEVMTDVRNEHKQEDAQMKALADMLEHPGIFEESCFPYEDLKVDEADLAKILDLIFAKVLIKEPRAKASELLADALFQ